MAGEAAQPASARPAFDAAPPHHPGEPSAPALAPLAERSQDVRAALERAAAESGHLPGRLEALTRRLDAFLDGTHPPGLARLDERLARLAEHVLALARATAEASSAATARLDERLAVLDHRLEALGSDPARPAGAPAGRLERGLAEVLERLEALGTIAAAPALDLTRRMDEQMSEFERRLVGLASELATPVDTLAESLDERLARLADPLRSLPQRVDERLAGLLEPLRGVSDRLEARLAQLEGLSNAAADTKILAERVDRQLGQVAMQVAELVEGKPAGAVTESVQRLAAEVSALSRQVAESARPMREGIDGALREIHADSVPLMARLEEAAERLLAAAAGSGPLAERLDRLEDVLREVGSQADTAPLELMIRSLQERFEAVSTGSALEGLEERLGGVLQRLNLTAAEPVQQALTETLTYVRGLRGEAAIIAERAAKAALKDMSLASAADLDGVRQGFADLKALQASAERRTHATLKAIQAALESLATRLPPGEPTAESAPPSDPAAARLEAAVRRLRAAAGTPPDDTATEGTEDAPAEPEELLLDPSTPRHLVFASGPSFATPHEGEPGSVRASFIAAARRAQAASPDAASLPDGDASGGGANSTLMERIRRTFEGHRRPLLLALAFLPAAAGSLPIGAGTAAAREPSLSTRDAMPAVRGPGVRVHTPTP